MAESSLSDTFRVVARTATAEPPKVKGSRFLADVGPAASAAAAAAFVARVRDREPTATHHVWAYRLGPASPEERSSDDGEPHGSAGAPVLRQIVGRDLFETVAVVTRYYGGTQLGVGGLVRAYGGAAAAALDAAGVATRIQRERVELAFAFADTAGAMRLLDRFDTHLARQDHHAEGTVLVLDVRQSEARALREAFVDATSGRGRIVTDGGSS